MLRALLGFILILLVGIIGFLAVNRFAIPGNPQVASGGNAHPLTAKNDQLVIRILYGSEKQTWFEQALRSFNEVGLTIDDQQIIIEGEPLGSMEGLDEVFQGNRQAHLLAPASTTVLELANDHYHRLGSGDLLTDVVSVARSPVVIAMWRSQAEAMGWPMKAIGWTDMLPASMHHGGPRLPELARTHPGYSSSGLQSLLAVATVAAGGRMTVREARGPEVEDAVAGMERSVIHYGSSTGFLAKRMAADGPNRRMAAIVYENLVVEINQQHHREDLVAIYPREGTMWCDHPIGVVNRPWVDARHRTAAKAFIDFLRGPALQRRALALGFRPVSGGVAIDAPLDAAHGVDPSDVKEILTSPPAEVSREILRCWRKHKRPSHVAIVLDMSGSMRDDNKAGAAKTAAAELVGMLDDADSVSLLGFGSQLSWMAKDLRLGTSRPRVLGQLASLIPAGGTALYDAVAEAVATSQAVHDPQRLDSIVVLSDGADTDSRSTLDELTEELGHAGSGSIRVFTIAYGRDADLPTLHRISELTGARSYEGSPDTIRAVFRDMATFF